MSSQIDRGGDTVPSHIFLRGAVWILGTVLPIWFIAELIWGVPGVIFWIILVVYVFLLVIRRNVVKWAGREQHSPDAGGQTAYIWDFVREQMDADTCADLPPLPQLERRRRLAAEWPGYPYSDGPEYQLVDAYAFAFVVSWWVVLPPDPAPDGVEDDSGSPPMETVVLPLREFVERGIGNGASDRMRIELDLLPHGNDTREVPVELLDVFGEAIPQMRLDFLEELA